MSVDWKETILPSLTSQKYIHEHIWLSFNISLEAKAFICINSNCLLKFTAKFVSVPSQYGNETEYYKTFLLFQNRNSIENVNV